MNVCRHPRYFITVCLTLCVALCVTVCAYTQIYTHNVCMLIMHACDEQSLKYVGLKYSSKLLKMVDFVQVNTKSVRLLLNALNCMYMYCTYTMTIWSLICLNIHVHTYTWHGLFCKQLSLILVFVLHCAYNGSHQPLQ